MENKYVTEHLTESLIVSQNSKDEIIKLFNNLNIIDSELELKEISWESILPSEEYIIPTAAYDSHLYSVSSGDDLVDVRELLSSIMFDFKTIQAGALWNGGMDYEMSYYAEELGYENPENYSDEDIEVFIEYLDKVSVDIMNSNAFAVIRIIYE